MNARTLIVAIVVVLTLGAGFYFYEHNLTVSSVVPEPVNTQSQNKPDNSKPVVADASTQNATTSAQNKSSRIDSVRVGDSLDSASGWLLELHGADFSKTSTVKLVQKGKQPVVLSPAPYEFGVNSDGTTLVVFPPVDFNDVNLAIMNNPKVSDKTAYTVQVFNGDVGSNVLDVPNIYSNHE